MSRASKKVSLVIDPEVGHTVVRIGRDRVFRWCDRIGDLSCVLTDKLAYNALRQDAQIIENGTTYQ
jgi:hypothetical protein